MQKNNRTVIGSYRDPQEASEVIQDLKREGYSKEDIILYTKDESLTNSRDKQATSIQAKDEDYTEDRSAWDKIKDFFTRDDYNYDEQKENNDYDQSEDVLYPYREDIRDGQVVIVVHNYKEDTQEKGRTMGGLNTEEDLHPEDDVLTKGREFDRETDGRKDVNDEFYQ